MKTSEYIKILTELLEEHGDLEVETYSATFDRRPAVAPRLAYTKILNARQSKATFWEFGLDQTPENKGQKVVRV